MKAFDIFVLVLSLIWIYIGWKIMRALQRLTAQIGRIIDTASSGAAKPTADADNSKH